MCTFLLQNGALWDMELVHCGICATDLPAHEEVCPVKYDCSDTWKTVW